MPRISCMCGEDGLLIVSTNVNYYVPICPVHDVDGHVNANSVASFFAFLSSGSSLKLWGAAFQSRDNFDCKWFWAEINLGRGIVAFDFVVRRVARRGI